VGGTEVAVAGGFDVAVGGGAEALLLDGGVVAEGCEVLPLAELDDGWLDPEEGCS
jgi:hypothetical protein